VKLATASDVNTEQLLAFEKILVTDGALAKLAERTSASGKSAQDKNERPFDIIETASLTEKSSLLSEKQNKYVFRVRPRANKIQIKQAIEKLFQKKCEREHLQLRRQKETGAPRRLRSQTAWKKAIVTLKEGEKIDLV